MLNGDWVGRAVIGAGVAFVVIGAGAAAFMGDDDASYVEVRSEMRAEAPESPDGQASVDAVVVEGFSLAELPRRIEAAIAEEIEAEIAASIETGDFDLSIDGVDVTGASWQELDADEREERLAHLRAKVAELRAEVGKARADDNRARAALLERVLGSLERLVERLESFEG